MAGRAVVLRITPTTSEPIEPMRTERRGPRRKVEERPLGSPERFCPCVILVMDQLSKINYKVLSTDPQNWVNSITNSLGLTTTAKSAPTERDLQVRGDFPV